MNKASSKDARPAIGSSLWDVQEHLYYIPDHAGPVTEYVVSEGKVKGFFDLSYVTVDIVGRVADRVYPRRYKLSDIGKRVFYTAREAALYAKELTEKYERTWRWTGETPLRRTWEKYLEEST